MSECGLQCVFSIALVGFVWGATNPLIRAACKAQEDENSTASGSISGIILRFLKSFLNWRFSIPFALNQAGSIMFNVLVVSLPVTIVVPCVNAIQFISTVAVGRLLGEEMKSSSGKQMIGMILATGAIIGMLVESVLSLRPDFLDRLCVVSRQKLSFRALRGRECAWKLAPTVPNSSKIPSSEESNESCIPPLSGAVIDQLAKIYAEPQLRASQIQLDKNAEPPWDPDPRA